jgi:hypothetical protein
MILPLIVVFGVGAAAALYLAQRVRQWWVWVVTFLMTVISLHELSFAFRRVAEWIRIDLLVSIPFFGVCCMVLGLYAFWRGERVAALALAASLAGIPVFFRFFH